MSTHSGPGPRSISTWAWAEGESLQLNTPVLVNSIPASDPPSLQTPRPSADWVTCPHTYSQASANLSPATPDLLSHSASRRPLLIPSGAKPSRLLPHQLRPARTPRRACEAGGFSGAGLQAGHRTTCRPLCSSSLVGRITTIHSPSRNSLCARPSPQGTLRRQSKVAPKQRVAQAGAPGAAGGQTQPSTGVPPGLPERL